MRTVRRSIVDGDASKITAPGAEFARFVGTDASDTYFGGKRADVINGLGGGDTLLGGGGDDIIDGGDGNDSIAGDAGDDQLNGGAGDDLISSTDGADMVDGGDGRDLWIGNYSAFATALSFDEVSGALSNGTTLTGIEEVSLSGGSGDDRVVLSGERDATIDGGSGSDTARLDLTLGAVDTVSRSRLLFTFDAEGALSGTVSGSGTTSDFTFRNVEALTIAGRTGADVIKIGLDRDGVATPLTVNGGGGNDTISLGGSGYTVLGGTGDDRIVTSAAGQTIDGGEGNDSWTTTLAGGVTYDQASQSFSNGTTVTNIERISLISQGNANLPANVFKLSEASGLTVYAGRANDRFDIDLRGLDQGLTFVGAYVYDGVQSTFRLTFGDTLIRVDPYVSHPTPFIDLIGTDQDDVFSFDGTLSTYVNHVDGADGTDTLKLSLVRDVTFAVDEAGAITTNAGSFSDLERFDITVYYGGSTITTGALDDIVTIGTSATAGNTLSGGAGDDRLTGARGLDILRGDDGDDVLVGADGDDALNGGLGDDVLNGGDGNDTAVFAGAAAGVQVAVGAGAQDTIGAGFDTLTAIENLTGSSYADQLTGDFFANRLRGLDGNDVLYGLDGDDYLEGDRGGDRMAGGAGADTFAFIRLDDFEGGRDRILDFSHAAGDRIDLSAIDPERGGADQAFAFVGSAAFSKDANAFELRAQEQGRGTFMVQGDVNHDGVADFAVVVVSATPLVAGDFVL